MSHIYNMTSDNIGIISYGVEKICYQTSKENVKLLTVNLDKLCLRINIIVMLTLHTNKYLTSV